MKRLRDLFYSQPTPPLNDGLGKATKSLNEAIKELDIALTKLEEVSRLRKEMIKTAGQLTTLREKDAEESTLTYTASIVPVLITTFFRH